MMAGIGLLVVDLLEDFLRDWDPPRRASLLRATNELIGMARGHGIPVIWIRQEFARDLSDAFLEVRRKGTPITLRGTPGARVAAELDRRSGDPEIVKRRYSAFFGTDLDGLLAQLRVRRVIVAGINTHACVRMGVIDAYQRDLEMIVARDCIGSYDAEHEDVTLRYLDRKIASVLDNAQLRRSLETGAAA